MARGQFSDLTVAGPEESLATIRAVFENRAGAARDIVILNAGAAIYVAGLTDSLTAGIDSAARIIASGAAGEKFAAFVDFTQTL